MQMYLIIESYSLAVIKKKLLSKSSKLQMYLIIQSYSIV